MRSTDRALLQAALSRAGVYFSPIRSSLKACLSFDHGVGPLKQLIGEIADRFSQLAALLTQVIGGAQGVSGKLLGIIFRVCRASAAEVARVDFDQLSIPV